jgi:hypothetical protein
MNKLFYSLLSCLLISVSNSVAQSPELTNQISSLEKAIVPVEGGSKKYEPKITFMPPAGIRYAYDEIDAKGNKTANAFELNLSDLDSYAVREQTQKDIITVVLVVRNKQKLIKVIKNEEVQSYDEQATIIAKDIENARAISEIIKKAIAPAEKVMATRLKLAGYDAMVNWLTGNVKNVNLGTKSFTQSLAKAEKPGSLTFNQVEANGKTSTEEVYQFNLADLNVNSIVFKITGNKFAVNVKTLQDAKYISLRRSGEVKPYVNEITINTNSVDEARDLKTVLALAIPLAVEKVKADIPASASDKDALQKIQALTTEIVSGPKQITQSFEPQCSCTLTQVEKDAKAAKKNVFKFNWIDVNPTASAIEVTGDRMYLDLNVNEGKKLIMNTEDDKFSGYEKDVKLYMPDIESARRAKIAADKAVEKCKVSYKEPFGNDVGSTTNWMVANIKDVLLDGTTVSQKVEQVEAGKNNKYKYIRKELNAKGTGAEEVYEFSLSDINPLSVEVIVKGKWLYVTMDTDFKGKIIKAYKDGKPQPYTSTIEFAVPDVDTSRNMTSAFKKSVKALKPK